VPHHETKTYRGWMTLSLLTNLLRLYDESVARERIRTNLVDWATEVMTSSGLVPAAHHRFLLESLDQVCAGKVKRLLVLMPPGSAKSTYVSVNTDLWGQYMPTPATAGAWYVWAEGTDGSAAGVYPTSFNVT
jgi:hypothetical protein